MMADAAMPVSLILAVGLGVGWVSAATGLGAGLSLPLLTAAGLPLPSALLAVKLPVTVSDLAAALSQARCPPPRDAMHSADVPAASTMGWAGVAGAMSMGSVLLMDSTALLLAAPLVGLGVLVWVRPSLRSDRVGTPQALCWGTYVGGCGIGAAMLWRLSGWWCGWGATVARPEPAHSHDALPLFASANLGALLVLLLQGQQPTPALYLLAGAQGLGAWAATAWRRSTRGPRLLARLRSR